MNAYTSVRNYIITKLFFIWWKMYRNFITVSYYCIFSLKKNIFQAIFCWNQATKITSNLISLSRSIIFHHYLKFQYLFFPKIAKESAHNTCYKINDIQNWVITRLISLPFFLFCRRLRRCSSSRPAFTNFGY